uniref:Uncharacterized protein n=1 Tax=Romanomermis culicivorax TaxID=13658 RepID=A0A915I0A5_ROMCU
MTRFLIIVTLNAFSLVKNVSKHVSRDVAQPQQLIHKNIHTDKEAVAESHVGLPTFAYEKPRKNDLGKKHENFITHAEISLFLIDIPSSLPSTLVYQSFYLI